ncbi:MAG: 2'-deoxycytidine 5'-triphosphate deaminase [Pseudomonadota bacterium]
MAGRGVLPAEEIEVLATQNCIAPAKPFDPDQVQPSSLDLRLGTKAYRVRASFLPGPDATVADKLKTLALHEIELSEGAVLEVGCVYVVPLLESLALPDGISAACNPKSSTGRLDVFTRVICDRVGAFDTIPHAYDGPLYAEISPRTFPVLVRTGSRLSQVRFRSGSAVLNEEATRKLHAEQTLVHAAEPVFGHGIAVSVDLSAEQGMPVGYRAKRHTAVIDVDRKAQYEVSEFWETIYATGDGSLILDPDQFYILASKEAVHVPPDHAAEMVAFDPLVGEFRVHYAGFFDPGFGHRAAGGSGSRAVLEVRSHEVPFILEDGQTVGRLVYERLSATPKRLYGTDIGSHYQAQGLKLSKHFKAE